MRMAMLVGIAAVCAAALVSPRAWARPTATPEGIIFRFDAPPGASRVTIAGEFNSWAPAQDAMTKVEGTVWQITLKLAPGRYQYKFVVDGSDWRSDPDNPLWVPDPYGGRNSVVVVRPDRSLDFSARGPARTGEPVVASLEAHPKPLHLAIVWHQHQPRYFKDPDTGEYLEPWVRIHGIKDYYDMAAMLEVHPEIKFTVNLTAVLVAQLEEIVAAYDGFASGPLTPGRPAPIPGCDRWVRLTLTPAELLTDEEKITILKNSFRMPRQTMIDPHPRFAELADKGGGGGEQAIRRTLAAFTDADWRDLQAWFNLAEFDPDFRDGDVWLPDGETVTVAHLVAKGRDFTEADKAEIIETQFKILRNIIPLHRRLQDEGRMEVITSPFYHPILPLLCDTDVAREADSSLDLPDLRFTYPEDARAQVAEACDFYRRRFGLAPRGMWPSEGSVSEAILPILAESGIAWIASDEAVLAKSLGLDRLPPEEKYRTYYVGKDAARLGIIFRDRQIYDQITSVYPKIGGVEAANDLVLKLHQIHRSIQGLEGDYVVPIIMDGENIWEHFERDGKDFLHSLCMQAGRAAWLKTVTVSEYFDRSPPTMVLQHLAPGSWITPNFNTWIGEEEENTAWDYLALARGAVAGKWTSLDDDARRAVLSEIHIAEGSDWFWWYGLDWGSGADESFDEAFRGTLRKVYALIGEPVPDCLVVPIVSPRGSEPESPIRGPISPTADGVLTEPSEWDGAGVFEDRAGRALTEAGADVLAALRCGHDSENLWLRIETAVPPDALAADSSTISVYFSGKSDVGTRAYTGETAGTGAGGPGRFLNFGIASQLDLVLSGGRLRGEFRRGSADGPALDVPAIILSPIEGADFIEVAVPFRLIGLDTGDDLKFAVVGYLDLGEDAIPDSGFAALKIPVVGKTAILRTVDDPQGDDHGPGTYAYPSDPVFVPGAFDITRLEIMLDAEANLIFKVTVAGELTWPWGGITGYSLQAIDIYIDCDGLPNSGQRDLFTARSARTVPEHAWEYFVRASMDTLAAYDAAGTPLEGVKVMSYADPASRSVFIKFPRAGLEPAARAGGETWNVIVALLSHDGYAEGGVRPVEAARGQWVVGGCDSENLCPSIMDLVVEAGVSQEAVLAAYRSTGAPGEIPGIKVTLP